MAQDRHRVVPQASRAKRRCLFHLPRFWLLNRLRASVVSDSASGEVQENRSCDFKSRDIPYLLLCLERMAPRNPTVNRCGHEEIFVLSNGKEKLKFS